MTIATEEVYELPAPPDAAQNEGTRSLKLGETISMDELGPIIINPDGTMRRIANWNQLTKGEQASTLRQISARNKKRIEALKAQQLDSKETEVSENEKNEL